MARYCCYRRRGKCFRRMGRPHVVRKEGNSCHILCEIIWAEWSWTSMCDMLCNMWRAARKSGAGSVRQEPIFSNTISCVVLFWLFETKLKTDYLIQFQMSRLILWQALWLPYKWDVIISEVELHILPCKYYRGKYCYVWQPPFLSVTICLNCHIPLNIKYVCYFHEH